MLSLYCPEIGAEVRPGPRAILSTHRTSDGHVRYVRCDCGSLAVVGHRSGEWQQLRHASRPAAPAPAPVEALIA